MRLLLQGPLLLLSTGCQATRAPEAWEDLVVYGFVEYEGRETALRDLFDGAVTTADANPEAFAEGYAVTALGTDSLEEAGVVGLPAFEGAPPAILGASAATAMRADFDAVIEVVTSDRLEEVYGLTVQYDAENTTDRDCFLAGDCDTFQFDGYRVNTSFFGETRQSFVRQFRRVEADDGTPVVVQRTLSPTGMEIDSALFRVHQHYDLSLLWPGDSGTRRIETFWVQAEIIGADVPETVALSQAVRAMHQSAEELDAYLLGEPEE